MEVQHDKNRFAESIWVAALPVLYLWIVKLIEVKFSLNLSGYGIYPRKFASLPGILATPFIHADFMHLISNSFPLLILGASIRYFYKEVFYRVVLIVYILSGTGVWLFARDAWHIGASGVVYGLAGFLFFSGFFRKAPRLIGLSLLVIFLYGGMIWGIFPIYRDISWEAHLAGAASGLLCAFLFRHIGPQRTVYEWEEEEENQSDSPFDEDIERTEDDFGKQSPDKPDEHDQKEQFKNLS